MSNRALWQFTASSVTSANVGEKIRVTVVDNGTVVFQSRTIFDISQMVRASERVIQKQHFELNDYDNDDNDENVLMIG